MGLSAELINQLNALLGAERVLTDQASCVFYAQDVFTRDKAAAAVLRPASTAECRPQCVRRRRLAMP